MKKKQARKPMFSWRELVLQSNLPPTTRHVLLTLSCHMNSAGESCFPSIKTLCQETGLSKMTVCVHLKKAREEGYLSVSTKGFNGQGWRRNEYFISIPDYEGGITDILRTQQRGQPDTKGGQSDSKKVVKEVDTSISKRIHKRIGRFAPPSLDQVKSYCEEKGYHIDPHQFCDFYQAKGWMVGKNKMKDWKAAVRTWARRAKDFSEEQYGAGGI